MTELILKDITLTLSGAAILNAVSMTVRAGDCVALLGPNGAGKSTLLRTALGWRRPDSGAATFNGAPTSAMAPAMRAQAIAYLPQTRPLAWPLRVRDVVALGRFAHGAAPGRLSEADAEAVTAALHACDLDRLADRSAPTLSGGESARMHLARALASRAPLLIADEPTAALDPLHAWRVMDIVRGFAAQGGAALIVTHDLSLAARFATRFVVMGAGRILADAAGAPPIAALEEAYGVAIGPAPDGGLLLGAPLEPARARDRAAEQSTPLRTAVGQVPLNEDPNPKPPSSA